VRLAPLVPRTGSAEVPLTRRQERRLRTYGLKLPPGRIAAQMAVWVDGDLRCGELERAAQALVARHESLRTSYRIESGGAPVASIRREGAGVRIVQEANACDAPDPGGTALDLASAGAAEPFDLANGDVFRCTLIRVSPDRSLLVLTMDHLIGDGHSLGVIFDELSCLYELACAGRDLQDALPKPMQLGDYAAWESDFLAHEEQRLASAWREFLGGPIDEVLLPTQMDRRSATFRGEHSELALSRAVAEGLWRARRAGGCTDFMAGLAALSITVGRLVGSRSVMPLVPTSGRLLPGSATIVGNLVNLVPIKVSRAESFIETCAKARDSTIWAIQHQMIPFYDLCAHLNPGNELGPGASGHVFFSHDRPSQRPFARLRAKPATVKPATSMFDLSMWMVADREGGQFESVWKADLFRRPMIEAIAVAMAAELEHA
jgi:Condensation domain